MEVNVYHKAKASGRCALCLRLPRFDCPCLKTTRRAFTVIVASSVLACLSGCRTLDVKTMNVNVSVNLTGNLPGH